MTLACVFSVVLVIFVELSASKDQLLAVSLLYRHGDRTPVKFYRNDPYQDPALWPTGMGELTNIGKKQHYELGQWMRNRYNGFLSQTYEKDEIYIRSSDGDRCIMSAEANLAGLYPPIGKDIWKTDFSWQPIPIHSIPKKYDDIAEFKTSCSKYKKLVKKVIAKYFSGYNNENKVIYDYLTEKTGEKIEDFKDASSIYGTLHVEQIYNFSLPEWSIPVYSKLREFKTINKKVQTITPKLNRLANGRLFDNILSQFSYFVNGTNEVVEKAEKFRIFSAHDTQVAAILNGLNVPHDVDIPYAAAIIFELRRKEDRHHYVQVLYKTKIETADIIQIGGCDSECDYDEFLDIMEPISITEDEFEEECNN